jgi:hypothetical protein
MTVPPHLIEDSTHSLFMLFFLSINFWWKGQENITPVLGLFRQRTITWSDVTILQERYLLLVIYMAFKGDYKKKHMLSCIQISAF